MEQLLDEEYVLTDPDHKLMHDARAAINIKMSQARARQWIGTPFRLEVPVAVHLLLQVSAPQHFCVRCNREHGWIIVQQIATKQRRMGHGTKIMQELMDAAANRNMGVMLQAVMSEGSRGLVRKLQLMPMPYDPSSFLGCCIRNI
jgi:hypothetical protein